MSKRLAKRYAEMKDNKKKGFTLVELIVVMGIMAVLALIMIPNLTAYIGKAEVSKLQANMKNVHTSAELSRQTNQGTIVLTEVQELSNIDEITLDETGTVPAAATADTYTVYENGDDIGVIAETESGKAFIFEGKGFTPVE